MLLRGASSGGSSWSRREVPARACWKLPEFAAEGLVAGISNKGSLVASVSAKEARQPSGVRSALEALAGRLYVINATLPLRKPLVRAPDRVERLPTRDASVLVAKDAFYDVLFEAGGNEALRDRVGSLHARASVIGSLSLSIPRPDDPQRRAAARDHHAKSSPEMPRRPQRLAGDTSRRRPRPGRPGGAVPSHAAGIRQVPDKPRRDDGRETLSADSGHRLVVKLTVHLGHVPRPRAS